MGSKDETAPVSQGYGLEQKMGQLDVSGDFKLFVHEIGPADIPATNEMAKRIEQFLSMPKPSPMDSFIDITSLTGNFTTKIKSHLHIGNEARVLS